MAQARRIKPKRSKAKKNTRRSLSNVPWGLILVVVLSIGALWYLWNGAKRQDATIGAGLSELLAQRQQAKDANQYDPEISEHIETKSVDKEFGFYDLLKDMDKVMPDDLPESEPIAPSADIDYFLQAASFRAHADAEKLRARLALKGFKSVTQAREVEGKGIFYRVRLGPYADRRKAKNAKTQLQRMGVRPYIYSVKK